MDIQQVITWLRRLLNDTRVFEDVRSNPTATIPGFLVVIVSTFIAGLGGWLWWMLQDFGDDTDILIHSAIIGSLAAIVLWGVWLLVVYVMLTQIFRQRAYLEQLLRVMGLASAPLALMGFMFIPLPFLPFAIGLASLGLLFGLTCVAISTVSTATPSQVLLSNLAGFLVWAFALSMLASGSGIDRNPHAPGIFLYQAIVDLFADAADAQSTLP